MIRGGEAVLQEVVGRDPGECHQCRVAAVAVVVDCACEDRCRPLTQVAVVPLLGDLGDGDLPVSGQSASGC